MFAVRLIHMASPPVQKWHKNTLLFNLYQLKLGATHYYHVNT